MSAARELADWAHHFVPEAGDLALAERSLRDTVAVALAAAGHQILHVTRDLGPAARWGVAAHVLDFDDLHMGSTAHVSAVVVPATVAAGGGARAYLAGAGVMARLGSMLGWPHYQRGWHTTCTAGAPAAAVAAAVAFGLDQTETTHALALALPAAGGVQRGFGTDAKSLQVGMAAEAGLRAAGLVARGARADPAALDQWLELVGASRTTFDPTGPAVPGGLAIKLFPCCYAMQRPIHAVRAALAGAEPQLIESVLVRTPASTVVPLVFHRPRTGLESKFSLEYGVAAAALDGFPTFASFTDDAVRRPAAAALMDAVVIELQPGGAGLLEGSCDVVVRFRDGSTRRVGIDQPPGAPARPPTREEFDAKVAGCGAEAAVQGIDWMTAAAAFEVGRPDRPVTPHVMGLTSP